MVSKVKRLCWNPLLEKITSFCNRQAIQILNMNGVYLDIIRSRWVIDFVTVEHHYHADVLTTVIDYKLKKLNCRFSEQAT